MKIIHLLRCKHVLFERSNQLGSSSENLDNTAWQFIPRNKQTESKVNKCELHFIRTGDPRINGGIGEKTTVGNKSRSIE